MRYVPVFISIWLAAGAFGQNVQPDKSNQDPNTLEEYLRYAAIHNAGLRAAFEEWRMAVLAVEPAGTLEDPRFTYGYFIEEVETRVGPQKHRLSLSQTFPWFGTLELRKDAAAAAARATGKRYEAKKLELFEAVKGAFYEYAYLGRSLQIARENLALLTHFEEVARALYRTAEARHPDIIRAQIELAELEEQVLSLEDLRRSLSAKISAVLNRPETGVLPWPVWEDRMPAPLDFAALPDPGEVNPEMEALDHEIDVARSRAKLAGQLYYPSITLGADWIVTDEARSPNVWGSGRDPIIAMFTLNLPIWTQSYRAQLSGAQANVRRTGRLREQRGYDLEAQIARVTYELRESRRKIDLYREVLLPRTREMVRVSEEAYRAGTLDFLSLIDAQRKLLVYALALERSLASHFQQQAQLERLLGGQMPVLSLTE